MIPDPERYGRIVDRAEAWAMEHEPTLARLPRLERRRQLAEAVYFRLRLQAVGR